MKIIFFGTSEFALPALEKLKASSMMPLLIVSTPDKPRGRNLILSTTPAKEWALKNNVPVITPEKLKDPETLIALKKENPDIFIVAAYGKIIPKEILDIPPKGTINIHPSLLPRLRGPSPIQTAILNNEETGVTIMLTDEQIDHGPILEASRIKNQELRTTYKKLEKALAELGAELLIKVLPQWLNGEIELKKQDHAKATFTKKITKEDGHIDWRKPAEIIERKIRALNLWPGTYTFWERNDPSTKLRVNKKMRLLILEAIFGNRISEEGYTPGTVFKTKNGELAIATQNNFLIVTKIKPEGKKEMTGEEFLKGYSHIKETILT